MRNWEMKLVRQGWADALVELGEKNPNVAVFDADLSKSTLTNLFKDKFPTRSFNVGIAEQNMVNMAGGFSLMGFVPFCATYGVFMSGRAWEQIRNTVCMNKLNVKFGGAHGGLSVGPDGASHQALEEIAVMRCLPNMTVIVPADYNEAKKATLAAAEIVGPVYLRFGREKLPVISAENTEFIVGKAKIMQEGTDVTIVACGAMVAEALEAADTLKEQGISAEVINLHTIKPIDKDALIASAKKTGAVVTAEEHQIMGGLGSAVSEVLSANFSVPMGFVGVDNTFGESGTPEELMKKYGCKSANIVERVLEVLKRKK
ncbi:MAG: transketolase family protein [Candidatus Peregrinibacteria bacterium]|nr:transketolase family protein [Candidatus Peregrinibacteria bacterium]